MGAGSWLLRNARVIDPATRLDACFDVLLCPDGISLTSVGELVDTGATADPVEFDAEGLWLFPGLFDMHVHLRYPGSGEAETLASGLACALSSGITSLCMMPNTSPPIDSPEIVSRILRESSELGYPDASVVACLTVGREGRKLADLEALHEAGAIAFSDDGSPLEDDVLFREALARLEAIGSLLIEHPERMSLSRGGVVNQGPVSMRAGVAGIPADSELDDVRRCIELAGETGARLHLTHLSCRRSVELVSQARDCGAPVTCDVTPHHLALSEELVETAGTLAKMNPPLRSEEDRAGLVRLVASGKVDAVASDHAPHPDSTKKCHLTEAAFGITGLDTLLPVTLQILVEEGGVSVLEVLGLLTTGPSSLLRRRPLPSVAEGDGRTAVLFDPEASYTLRDTGTLSLSRNTPFWEHPLRGRTLAVWAGRPVYWKGHFD
jgi:dihydroorotase